MRYTIGALLVLVFTGCDEHHEIIDPGPGPLTLPLQVNLRAGESIRLPQLGFIARFDSVTSDSRCPLGVDCFWQGDGATRLSIFREKDPAVTCTLHTTLSPRLIEVGDVVIQLKDLQPYPRQPGIIPPGAYVVALEIDRPEGSRGRL
jgi:hypothetical protein